MSWPKTFLKKSGQFKRVHLSFFKKDGAWNPVSAAYKKVNGSWVPFFLYPRNPSVSLKITTASSPVEISTAYSIEVYADDQEANSLQGSLKLEYLPPVSTNWQVIVNSLPISYGVPLQVTNLPGFDRFGNWSFKATVTNSIGYQQQAIGVVTVSASSNIIEPQITKVNNQSGPWTVPVGTDQIDFTISFTNPDEYQYNTGLVNYIHLYGRRKGSGVWLDLGDNDGVQSPPPVVDETVYSLDVFGSIFNEAGIYEFFVEAYAGNYHEVSPIIEVNCIDQQTIDIYINISSPIEGQTCYSGSVVGISATSSVQGGVFSYKIKRYGESLFQDIPQSWPVGSSHFGETIIRVIYSYNGVTAFKDVVVYTSGYSLDLLPCYGFIDNTLNARKNQNGYVDVFNQSVYDGSVPYKWRLENHEGKKRITYVARLNCPIGSIVTGIKYDVIDLNGYVVESSTIKPADHYEYKAGGRWSDLISLRSSKGFIDLTHSVDGERVYLIDAIVNSSSSLVKVSTTVYVQEPYQGSPIHEVTENSPNIPLSNNVYFDQTAVSAPAYCGKYFSNVPYTDDIFKVTKKVGQLINFGYIHEENQILELPYEDDSVYSILSAIASETPFTSSNAIFCGYKNIQYPALVNCEYAIENTTASTVADDLYLVEGIYIFSLTPDGGSVNKITFQLDTTNENN